MEEKPAAEKTSEDLKRPTVDVTTASLAPPRPEPPRPSPQGRWGIPGSTKSKSNQPEDVRPDTILEVPAVPLKTEAKDHLVGTRLMYVVVDNKSYL